MNMQMKNHRCALSSTAVAAALGVLSVANAQSPNTQDQSDRALEEVVVTAQRREERLRDVPISITALSAKTLEESGIQDTRDLPLITPGLRVDSVGAYVQPAIRGITTTLTSGPEANVATYLDGVYRPNTFAAIYDLPDVKQIEVLKGPQGTLFGRNATGGAILITTLSPDLNQTTGKVSAGYGSFSAINANGFISVPLVADRLAVSLSAYYDDVADGWKRNLVTNQKTGAGIETGLVRGKVRFVPVEGADFTLTALYSWRNDDSSYRPSNWRGNNDLAGVPGVINPSRPWIYAVDQDVAHDSRAEDVSLRGEIEAGPGTLTTTTAYAHSYADLLFDTDNTANRGAGATTDTDYESFTQELVYATDQLGAFRAVGGLFFFDSESNNQPYFVPAFNGFQLWFRDKATSYAAFGELTYDITDQLALTGGLRYSWEEKEGAAATKFSQRPLIAPPLNLVGKESWDALTPRVTLLYKATDDTNLYATYSQGFKSGLFNTPGFQATPVDPEQVDAYEIGIKSDVTPSLGVNAAGFYYDYKDLQVPSLENVNNVLTQRILNAASAEIWGAEINVDLEVTSDFSIIAGGSYLHAEYSSFPVASINVPVAELPVPPGNARCTETPRPTSGLCNVLANVSGNQMIRTPEWSGSITGNFNHDFASGTLTLSGTVFYSSEVFYEFGNRVRQPAYEKLNASAGWRFDGGVQVRLWGRNLTDEAVLTSLVGTSGYDAVDYERPREYGVEVSYKF